MGARSSIKIVSPLRVPVSCNKFFLLNTNNYRNAHHRVLSTSKTVYKQVMQEEVSKVPVMARGCSLVYTLYPKTRRKMDLDNGCAIICKYFNDCLVTSGKLPDDNIKYIQSIDFRYGRVDKHFPRVEILITPT